MKCTNNYILVTVYHDSKKGFRVIDQGTWNEMFISSGKNISITGDRFKGKIFKCLEIHDIQWFENQPEELLESSFKDILLNQFKRNFHLQ